MRKIVLSVITILTSTSLAQKAMAFFKSTDNQSSYNSPLVLSNYNGMQTFVVNAHTSHIDHMSHASHMSHYSCHCQDDIIKEIPEKLSNSMVNTVVKEENIKDYVLDGSRAYIKVYKLEGVQFSEPLRCLCVYILTYQTGHYYYIPVNRNSDTAYIRVHSFSNAYNPSCNCSKRKKTTWMKELVNRVLDYKVLTK